MVYLHWRFNQDTRLGGIGKSLLTLIDEMLYCFVVLIELRVQDLKVLNIDDGELEQTHCTPICFRSFGWRPVWTVIEYGLHRSDLLELRKAQVLTL